MRCLASSLFFASLATAEEQLPLDSGDAALHLLQLKTTKIEHAERRPKTHSTEAESMQAAECDLWGDVHMTKTFYGYAEGRFGDYGGLYINHKDGERTSAGDPMQKGLYRMAASKDGRFEAQLYQSGTPGVIQAVAFNVDGTAIRVRPPKPLSEADAIQWGIDNDRANQWPLFPQMEDAYGKAWLGSLPMNIRVNGQVYSQSDFPLTIPGTNIQLKPHSFAFDPHNPNWIMPGFIVETEGFRAQVEQIASTGDSFWMNVNFKLTPENIPDRDANDFCGMGPKATVLTGDDPENKGPDGDGDWESSLFTKEDHEAICYFASRMWGGRHAGPDFRNYADQDAFGVCRPPPVEPAEKPTAKSQCDKIQCDYSRGQQLCAPVEDSKTWFEDCLLDFCMNCEDGAAEIFVGDVVENFPDDGEDDEASAEADPHLTTNTQHKFDFQG